MPITYKNLVTKMRSLGNQYRWSYAGMSSWNLISVDSYKNVYHSDSSWEVEKLSEQLIEDGFDIDRMEYFKWKNSSTPWKSL